MTKIRETVVIDIEDVSVPHDRAQFLSNVYHSTSYEEMQLKIAQYGEKLTLEDVKWLADCLTYHAAFWPHTLPRYNAFVNLIKHDKDVRKVVRSTEFITFCLKNSIPRSSFAAPSKDDASYVTDDIFEGEVPGKKLQSYYYIKIIEIAMRMKFRKYLSEDRKHSREMNGPSSNT